MSSAAEKAAELISSHSEFLEMSNLLLKAFDNILEIKNELTFSEKFYLEDALFAAKTLLELLNILELEFNRAALSHSMAFTQEAYDIILHNEITVCLDTMSGFIFNTILDLPGDFMEYYCGYDTAIMYKIMQRMRSCYSSLQ